MSYRLGILGWLTLETEQASGIHIYIVGYIDILIVLGGMNYRLGVLGWISLETEQVSGIQIDT